MTTARSRTSATVAEFLKHALANGALDVPELEAMAHKAGLLGPRQQMRHAKAFKKAKRSLGITIHPRWVWEQGKVGMASAHEAKEGAGLYKGCEHLRASSFSSCQFERLARGAIERAHPSSLGSRNSSPRKPSSSKGSSRTSVASIHQRLPHIPPGHGKLG
jgi:hypothetical protein